MVKKEYKLVVFWYKENIIAVMDIKNSQLDKESTPEIIDLGSASDLINGLGGSKEPGGFDGDFAPLQVS